MKKLNLLSKAKKVFKKLKFKKRVSNLSLKFLKIFLSTFLALLSSFIIFYLLLLYFSQNRFTEERLFEVVKKEFPKSELEYKFIKADLKGLGNESLIFVSKEFHDFKSMENNKNNPKIMIFDEINKNPFENLIYGNSKLYEIKKDFIQKESWFFIRDVKKIKGENKDYFIFCSSIVGHSHEVYCGIISWDIWNGYFIKPLFDKNNDKEIIDNNLLIEEICKEKESKKEYVFFSQDIREEEPNRYNIFFGLDNWEFSKDGLNISYYAGIYNECEKKMTYSDFTNDTLKISFEFDEDKGEYSFKSIERLKDCNPNPASSMKQCFN